MSASPHLSSETGYHLRLPSKEELRDGRKEGIFKGAYHSLEMETTL